MPTFHIHSIQKGSEATAGPRALTVVESELEFRPTLHSVLCLPPALVALAEPLHRGFWRQWPSLSCFDLPLAVMMGILRTSRMREGNSNGLYLCSYVVLNTTCLVLSFGDTVSSPEENGGAPWNDRNLIFFFCFLLGIG